MDGGGKVKNVCPFPWERGRCRISHCAGRNWEGMTISSEIGLTREALAHALETFTLSMDSNQRSYAWEKDNVTELFQDI
jgi:hypothetical protein